MSVRRHQENYCLPTALCLSWLLLGPHLYQICESVSLCCAEEPAGEAPQFRSLEYRLCKSKSFSRYRNSIMNCAIWTGSFGWPRAKLRMWVSALASIPFNVPSIAI